MEGFSIDLWGDIFPVRLHQVEDESRIVVEMEGVTEMMALAAQTSIISTAVVGAIVLLAVGAILRSMYKKKKRTGTFIGCDCGCGCEGCPHSCHGGCCEHDK